ncbi:hypothetical protein AB0E01_44540, partial [Nocardia vinacea]|uniref:hypothetical protein n=1 Tax=Nocardia vinacea TaxID=96468 RepID=UPI0033C35431
PTLARQSDDVDRWPVLTFSPASFRLALDWSAYLVTHAGAQPNCSTTNWRKSAPWQQWPVVAVGLWKASHGRGRRAIRARAGC